MEVERESRSRSRTPFVGDAVDMDYASTTETATRKTRQTEKPKPTNGLSNGAPEKTESITTNATETVSVTVSETKATKDIVNRSKAKPAGKKVTEKEVINKKLVQRDVSSKKTVQKQETAMKKKAAKSLMETSDYSSDEEGKMLAFNTYKAAGDWWETFPKTDFVYSPASRYRDSTVAPGVKAVPNMSRRSLRSSSGSVTTGESAFQSRLSDSPNPLYNPQWMPAGHSTLSRFSDAESDGEDVCVSRTTTTTTTTTTVWTRITTTVVTVFGLLSPPVHWLMDWLYLTVAYVRLLDCRILAAIPRRPRREMFALLFAPLLLAFVLWLAVSARNAPLLESTALIGQWLAVLRPPTNEETAFRATTPIVPAGTSLPETEQHQQTPWPGRDADSALVDTLDLDAIAAHVAQSAALRQALDGANRRGSERLAQELRAEAESWRIALIADWQRHQAASLELSTEQLDALAERLAANGRLSEKLVANGRLSETLLANGKLSESLLADGKLSEMLVANGKLSETLLTNGRLSEMLVANAKLSETLLANGKLSESLLADGRLSEMLVANGRLSEMLVANGKLSETLLANGKLSEMLVANGKLSETLLTNGRLSEMLVANAKLSETLLANGKLSESLLADGRLSEMLVANGRLSEMLVANGKLSETLLANGKLAETLLANGKLSEMLVANGKLSETLLANGKLSESLLANGKLSESLLANGKLVELLVASGGLAGEATSPNDEALVERLLAKLLLDGRLARSLLVGGELVHSLVVDAQLVDKLVAEGGLAERLSARGELAAKMLDDGRLVEQLLRRGLAAELVADGALVETLFGEGDLVGRLAVDGRIVRGILGDVEFSSRLAARAKAAVDEALATDARLASLAAIDGRREDNRVSDLQVELSALAANFDNVLQQLALLQQRPRGSSVAVSADVESLVSAMIARYDADKTGRADFALESNGGSVLSTRCSETHTAGAASITLLGVPLWTQSSNPRKAIQPGTLPGQCWAFKGARGFLVVQLSGMVKVTDVSIEHMPRELSRDERIASAPRRMKLLGLATLEDPAPLHLGTFEFIENGPSLQVFAVKSDDEVPPLRIVELQIESNHGHQEYTCLYRFRVHGKLVGN